MTFCNFVPATGGGRFWCAACQQLADTDEPRECKPVLDIGGAVVQSKKGCGGCGQRSRPIDANDVRKQAASLP